MDPAIFLDRDGVLNLDIGYACRRDQIVWVDGAFAALRRLNRLGYRIFVVTNQAGIAHGFYGEEDVHRLHEWMSKEVTREGGRIDEFRYCPHHPQGSVAAYRRICDCRKPGPAMLRSLIDDWSIDPAISVLIGDKESDVQAASAAGIRGFLFPGGDLDSFVRDLLKDEAGGGD